MIAVTGATGTIGLQVTGLLAGEPGVAVRIATRRPDRYEPGIAVGFDWNSATGADAVVADADALMVVPPSGVDPLPTVERLLEAAHCAAVRQVVFLSTFGADLVPGFAFGRWALTAERAVLSSGLAATILCPNSYMSNFTGIARPGPDGAMRLPWGLGEASFIDPRDVAEAAVRVLLAPAAHAGRTYELTGPEALNAYAVADTLGAAAKVIIRYVDTPPAAFEAALVGRGVPPAMAAALLELHGAMASGARARITDHAARLLGRRPGSLRQFAHDHRQQWSVRSFEQSRPPVGATYSGRT